MSRIIKKVTIDQIVKREQRTITYIKAMYQSYGFDSKAISYIETKNKKYMLMRDNKEDYRVLKSYDLSDKELKHISPRNRHNYRYNKR